MKRLLFVGLAVLLPTVALASGANPFITQCHRLANLNAESPIFQHFAPHGFWQNRAMANKFLLALRGQFSETKHSDVLDMDVRDRSGVILASIVKHNLPLLKRFYNASASSYFIKTGWSILTFAAACNFKEGVSYLLEAGADPNAGTGVGSFNVALVNNAVSTAIEILDHGYLIELAPKRCYSSKYIIAHSQINIPHSISAAVESAVCPAMKQDPRTRDN